MTSFEDVAAFALALPEVTEGVRWGHRTWQVNGKAFAWQRPLSKADLTRLGSAAPPGGELLAVSVDDLSEREALLAQRLPGFFTIEHFANYPAVLIQLDSVRRADLETALVDAWLCCAPKPLAQRYLAEH